MNDSLKILSNILKSISHGIKVMGENLEPISDLDQLVPPSLETEEPKIRKGSATANILRIIESSKKEVGMDTLIEKTGLKKSTIYGIVYRLKKLGKIKSKGHGYYTKA